MKVTGTLLPESVVETLTFHGEIDVIAVGVWLAIKIYNPTPEGLYAHVRASKQRVRKALETLHIAGLIDNTWIER